MRLHDLTVGQRFEFVRKHHGKTFEVTGKDRFSVVYMDVATGEDRMALSNRKTFRMDVIPVTEDKLVSQTQQEVEMLSSILYDAYTEAESEAERSDINQLHAKITGRPARERDGLEGE